MEIAVAPRAGAVVATLRGVGRAARCVHARAGRPADRLGRPGRDHRPERVGQVHAARGPARRARPGRGQRRRSGRGSSSARSTRPGRCSRASGAAAGLRRRRSPTGRRRRCGPCSPSTGSRPTTCCGRRRACRPASGPGPRWRCCRPAGSTCSCSTSRPTTSTCPRSSSWSRPWTPTAARCCSSATTAGCSTQVHVTRRFGVDAGDGHGGPGMTPAVAATAAALDILPRRGAVGAAPLVGRDDADFRDGQWEAVADLVAHRRRVLVVQRTGLGQVGGLLRRDRRCCGPRGAGPTLIVSPAARTHARPGRGGGPGRRAGGDDELARTPTSGTTSPGALAADTVDVLLVSPERLNNPRFRAELLPGPRRAGGSARRRRGALHQRLGARLPARLPADPRPARGPARRHPGARHDGDGERPGRRRTSPSSSRCPARLGGGRTWRPATACVRTLRVRSPGPACGSGCSRCRPPRSGSPGSPPTSTSCPAAASSTR